MRVSRRDLVGSRSLRAAINHFREDCFVGYLHDPANASKCPENASEDTFDLPATYPKKQEVIPPRLAEVRVGPPPMLPSTPNLPTSDCSVSRNHSLRVPCASCRRRSSDGEASLFFTTTSRRAPAITSRPTRMVRRIPSSNTWRASSYRSFHSPDRLVTRCAADWRWMTSLLRRQRACRPLRDRS